MAQVNPTSQLYGQLVEIARQFNRKLFANALPLPLFSLTREGAALGHLSRRRWVDRTSEPVCEIALSRSLFSEQSWLSLMQTIAVLQCQLWQQLFGSPGRPGYHNAQLADKLEEIGLMPTATGDVGGRRTGQSVTVYPIDDGLFIRTCIELMDGPVLAPVSIPWLTEAASHPLVDQLKLAARARARLLAPVGDFSDAEPLEANDALKALKRKLKYSCPKCSANVWGRPGLALMCQTCGKVMAVRTASKQLQTA
jgi:hypothetical protein